MIKKLSDRDHIRMRPNMYIGAVNATKSMEYILEDGKMVYKEVEYVPGLIKIGNEIIDNCVDVAIKSNFTSGTVISVKMTDTYMTVVDNGSGIPVKKVDGHYLPELCWNHARAGSNFDDDDNRTQIGMNGVGSYATACFSKKFTGITDDGENRYKIVIKNGAETFTEELIPQGTTGTKVTFEPDLEMFGFDTIDETHHLIIKQRLINLSMSFPLITFKFNGKKINTSTFRKYLQMFNDNFVMFESEDYRFAILPNDSDDFRQFSYVNGLKIPQGGTHIDIITGNVVNGIRDKLIKKYKTIKPGDIKNKLMVVAFLKNLPNPKFNSQTKEHITNTPKEIMTYYKGVEFDKVIAKILKTPEIIDEITEFYRAKEELARRKELKGLNKTTKKIKSEKYLPATGFKKYLIITEGASATGGLLPVLGRANVGYYELKGKPLNAIKASQKDFINNPELSELYKIIQTEGYQYIIEGTDQDLDGFHIRGLLKGFFIKYLPELKGKIGVLNTPVIGVKKGKVLQRWYYSLKDDVKQLKGETSKYYKGLGSWKESDLKHIVQTDGIQKMIDIYDFDDDEIILDWLHDDRVPQRKEYIEANDFSIAKL